MGIARKACWPGLPDMLYNMDVWELDGNVLKVRKPCRATELCDDIRRSSGPINAQSGLGLGNFETGSTLQALCHVRQAVPEQSGGPAEMKGRGQNGYSYYKIAYS